MKKFLLSFLLIVLTVSNLFAQRDTEHWIAPYYASTGSYANQLYLSTDSVTPFDVTVSSNNVVLGTVTISKGNPNTYLVPVANISVNTAADAFNVITKGVYLNATKPFFCTLRIAQGSHGEVVTSKGKAGLGREFYVAGTPYNSTSSSNNFTAGIMATENNTVVTTTWTGNTTFIGGSPTTSTNTVTLNKGESFIYAGTGSTAGNVESFIGARIVSDKPITLTNGNMNGNFGDNTGGGSDAILDQSVPVERLGSTFAMVRTRSTLADLEGGIVIATEDNTQVFVNGSTTPIATLNKGQWHRIRGDNYVQQGTSDHYNMLITASHNIYLYQLVSVGSTTSSNNTGGYNYIPPLNCFLPRVIDEIGKINEMPNIATSNIEVKLNIITEAGAVVLVNDLPMLPTEGPFPLTGNAGWVTYARNIITGNVKISSDKAVTAGINGGYSSAGYGGYFAGFSSVPAIAKQTGDCVPGIILEVDAGFDSYQWFLNGVAIPGATSNTFTPTTGGNYTVRVTMGTCAPVTTPIFKVFTCLQKTTQAVNICGSKVITPTFTTFTQVPQASSVTIVTQPQHGTATLNTTTGVITYIPTPGYLGPDQIVYKFCGTAPEFVDCEQFTLNLNLIPFTLTDRTIKACQYAGKGYFDLTTANVTDYTTPVTKKYFPTLADLNANTNQITNPTNYFSGAGFVYVLVATAEGCTAFAKITLDFFPVPVVKEATIKVCFIPENESKGEFNLMTANISDEDPITKKFYPTFTDASNNTNEIANFDQYISEDKSLYARVINSNGCYAIAKINLIVKQPKRSPLLVDQYICIDAKTNLDAGAGYQSYRWSTGDTTQTITNVPVGDYWVTLQYDGCFITQKLSVKKAISPVISTVELSNNTATVIVTGGKSPYKYSVDATNVWQDSNVFTGLTRGQHTFHVKDALNCAPVSAEVTVPNLINAITPNGDNVNDYIDYKELSYKQNLTFSIFDRYGNKVFEGDKFNAYRWDGTHFNKKIVTGTYWYNINWTENNTAKTPIKFTGWILVKNRE